MKAICWMGPQEVAARTVPDPQLLKPRDAIIRVKATTVSGADLHLFDGDLPLMERGDVLGHEFMGEVVELGSAVRTLAVGDRVVVPSIIACGACFFCKSQQWALCDNSNPHPKPAEELWGQAPCGMFGSSHLVGGYAGSFAELVRVPFADVGPRKVPAAVTDEEALYCSDSFPTGYMAAELCQVQQGDIVAVWGCGAVGQFAMKSAALRGARAIGIDRVPERLQLAKLFAGAETLDYTRVNVPEALRELTGGRGPDACIDAVGLDAQEPIVEGAGPYERARQAVRAPADRVPVVRDAVLSCRKGGTVAIVGTYAGLANQLPLGAAMNKGLILRAGLVHTHRYLDRVLELVAAGEVHPEVMVTHRMKLDDGQRAFDLFKHRRDGCVRVVFRT
jgi:threonine dehydrogenase-like Zn-dependent dehydrogenase